MADEAKEYKPGTPPPSPALMRQQSSDYDLPSSAFLFGRETRGRDLGKIQVEYVTTTGQKKTAGYDEFMKEASPEYTFPAKDLSFEFDMHASGKDEKNSALDYDSNDELDDFGVGEFKEEHPTNPSPHLDMLSDMNYAITLLGNHPELAQMYPEIAEALATLSAVESDMTERLSLGSSRSDESGSSDSEYLDESFEMVTPPAASPTTTATDTEITEIPLEGKQGEQRVGRLNTLGETPNEAPYPQQSPQPVAAKGFYYSAPDKDQGYSQGWGWKEHVATSTQTPADASSEPPECERSASPVVCKPKALKATAGPQEKRLTRSWEGSLKEANDQSTPTLRRQSSFDGTGSLHGGSSVAAGAAGSQESTAPAKAGLSSQLRVNTAP